MGVRYGWNTAARTKAKVIKRHQTGWIDVHDYLPTSATYIAIAIATPTSAPPPAPI